jgi:hypothetical protein
MTIVDRAGQSLELAVFPSVDPAFAIGIHSIPLAEPFTATCAQALCKGATVTSENIALDDRYAPAWRALCIEHNIRSCVSEAIISPQGVPLGTFVLGFSEPRAAGTFDRAVVAMGAKLIGLALQRRRAQEMQALTVGELNHRTKNIFTVLAALARYSFRAEVDLGECHRAFSARLVALSHAHSLMFSDEGADLATLIKKVMEPYEHSQALTLNGPDIALASEAVVSLMLTVRRQRL